MLKPATNEPRPDPVPLALALQGGGAWGAYTWGVLDELVERPDLSIESISGTSAGAINGAIIASALVSGSAQDARRALESFWHEVAGDPAASLLLAWTGPLGQAVTERLGTWMLSSTTLGPYQFDPLNLNPLRRAIAAHVDVDALRQRRGPALYVVATNVRTGLPRVFGPAEMSVDALMASACLPQIFQAVEIDGEEYWDGGYSGNPALWPLIHHHGEARDLLLVQLAANLHDDVPHKPPAIRRRAGEIAFNASLIAEMQAIHAMRAMCAQAGLDAPVVQMRFHRVGPPPERAASETSGALDRSWSRLTGLRMQGRQAAQEFLARHRDDLGVRSTLDLGAAFVNPAKPRLQAPLAVSSPVVQSA